jgi:hypothetical protein
MLDLRRDILLQTPEGVGAIGHEHNRLTRLDALLAQRIDEPGPWSGVHRLDEGETASGRIRDPAITMKRQHALAGDSLEPVLVAAANVPAVHSHKERPVRRRLVRPR